MIDQCPSHFNEYRDYLGILLKCNSVWVKIWYYTFLTSSLVFVDIYRVLLPLAGNVLPTKKLRCSITLYAPSFAVAKCGIIWLESDLHVVIFQKDFSPLVRYLASPTKIIIATATKHRYFPCLLINRIFSYSGMFLCLSAQKDSRK
jgi:hypothetical protein